MDANKELAAAKANHRNIEEEAKELAEYMEDWRKAEYPKHAEMTEERMGLFLEFPEETAETSINAFLKLTKPQIDKVVSLDKTTRDAFVKVWAMRGADDVPPGSRDAIVRILDDAPTTQDMEWGFKTLLQADKDLISIRARQAVGEWPRPASIWKNPAGMSKFLDEASFESMPARGTVDPRSIRFTQSTCNYYFKDGRPMHETVRALTELDTRPKLVKAFESGARVRLVLLDGKVYSIDNRRIVVFQAADVEVPYVKVDYKDLDDFDVDKFERPADSHAIRVRDDPPRK